MSNLFQSQPNWKVVKKQSQKMNKVKLFEEKAVVAL
jgi:hypothetical protein